MRKTSLAPSSKTDPEIETHFDLLSRIIFVSAAALYVLRNPQYNTGIVNDDALFVLGARSLAGRLSVPTMVIKPDFPLPGLPLVLSPFIRIVEPHWTRLEYVLIAVAIGLLFALGRWMRPFLSRGECLVALALIGFNPLIAKFSGIVMPSIPYTLMVVIALHWLGQLEMSWDVRKALGLGTLLGWASLMRPEGFLILLSALLVLVFHRQGRRMMWAVLLPLPLWGAFFYGWWQRHQTAVTGYGGDVQGLATFWRDQFFAAIPFTNQLLRKSFLHGFTAIQLPDSVLSTLAVLTVSLIGLAGVVIGWRALWKSHPNHRPVWLVIALFGAFYFGVHLFWHVAVPRYAIPLLPFVFFFGVKGFNVLLQQSKSRIPLTILLLAVLLSAYAYRNVRGLYEASVVPNPMKSPPWEALAWIKGHTPPQAVVVSVMAPSVELYADRSSIPGILAANNEMVLNEFSARGVSYILDRNVKFLAQEVEGTDNPNRYWSRMRFRFRSYPDIFEPVFENPKEQSVIYRVNIAESFLRAYAMVKGAYSAYLNGNHPEAERIARASLKLYPHLSAAQNLLGILAWKTNHFTEAEARFKEAAESMPTSDNAFLNLATLYRQTGREALSEQYVQNAYAIAEAKGNTQKMDIRLKELRSEWSQHRALIFMDVP